MNFLGLALTFFVGLFILIGTVFATKFKDNKRFTDFSISLAFGVIFALILFELIPETYEVLLQTHLLTQYELNDYYDKYHFYVYVHDVLHVHDEV